MKLKIFTGERIIVVICVPSFPRIENFAIIKKICPPFFISKFLVECLCDFLRKLEASGFIRVRSNGTMRIDSVRKISSSRTCKELAIDFNWLVIYRGGNSTIKGRNLINQHPTSVLDLKSLVIDFTGGNLGDWKWIENRKWQIICIRLIRDLIWCWKNSIFSSSSNLLSA